PGERFHFLVVHGRVIGTRGAEESGSRAAGRRVHRSYRRLAADAARAFAGADITQVSLLIAHPSATATADSVVVEDVQVDPDLVAFTRTGTMDVVERVVDLHLGASSPAPESSGTWAEDSERVSNRLLSSARTTGRKVTRRLRSL